jgi:alpha-galactosidase
MGKEEDEMLQFGSTGSADEKLDVWIKDAFRSGIAVPFSFHYKGVSSRALLAQWQWTYENRLAGGRETQWITIQAPDGLKVIVEVARLAGFAAVEWLLCFENAGETDSGLIENVRALSMCVAYPPFATAGTSQTGAHDNVLYYAGGSDCKIDDFIPLQEVLHAIANKARMHFGCINGRPTSGSHGSMPYFNLQTRDNGVIFALGWSGQWDLDVYTNQTEGQETPGGGWPRMGETQCFRFEGGMPDIHLALHPGEKIRSPRILMMPWVGDRIDAHNQFRRLMLKYHAPQIDGKPAMPPVAMASWGTRESEHLTYLDAAKKTALPVDTYWIDAGWYGPPGTHCDNPLVNDWYEYGGYTDHDPTRYPNGLKPVSDAAHALGMRFLLWFDPERAMYGSPATLEHPEYFLGKKVKGASLLLNLGDPAARAWMTNAISRKIDEYGIDILRVDYNIDPLELWNSNDTDNRRGMSQIRAVEGFYAMWDDLLARHPGLLIDNCASGGRRLDFEALTRSYALFRSDYLCYADNDPIGVQVQTGGLAFYVPVSTTNTGDIADLYRFRSTLSQGVTLDQGAVLQAAGDPTFRALLARRLEELDRVRDLFFGDYYPFTGVTIARSDWFAYQMNRPDLGRAVVISIRRDECPFEVATYPLHGLCGESMYAVEDADTGDIIHVPGEVLMKEGLTIHLPARRMAKTTYLSRIKEGSAMINPEHICRFSDD